MSYIKGKYGVTTLCGSMRFYRQMIELAESMTRRGIIVIMPYVADYAGKPADNIKTMLDEMHREKILMADSITVVTDENMYIGESTRAEIEFARERGILVHWENVS